MTKILCIKNDILSLEEKMRITNEHDIMLYEVNVEFSLVIPEWKIYKGKLAVASLSKKLSAWFPTWAVSCSVGDFLIKTKMWSWTRQYEVSGGPFDGIAVKGDIWDLEFAIGMDGKQIAKAKGDMLSMSDAHAIEVMSDDEKAELLTVIIMVALLLDRKSESNDSLPSPPDAG